MELSDSVGHGNGPNSKELRDTLIQIDKKIQKLMTLLKERNLEDDVNVMIYSDHGMAELSTSRIINITGVIDQADVKYVLDIGATVNIWPAEGKLEKVCSNTSIKCSSVLLPNIVLKYMLQKQKNFILPQK